jgi:hypothetical protein
MTRQLDPVADFLLRQSASVFDINLDHSSGS